MIYVLGRTDGPYAIIGTADVVRATRDVVSSRYRRAWLKPLLANDAFQRLRVLGQLTGDDGAAVAAIVRHFARAFPSWDSPVVLADSAFWEWAATLPPWDGSNAEQLGVRGLGRSTAGPRPVAVSQGLGTRVRRS